MKPLVDQQGAVGKTVSEIAFDRQREGDDAHLVTIHFTDGTALIIGVEHGWEGDWTLTIETDSGCPGSIASMGYNEPLKLMDEEDFAEKRRMMEESNARERARTEAAEREQYERLKRKYES